MQPPQRLISISEHIVNFKITKNPYHLLKAILLLIKRGRTHELLYGLYCQVRYAPSPVISNHTVSQLAITAINDDIDYYKRQYLSYQQILKIYGEQFAITMLPDDFAGTRSESIVITGQQCIIGEYGMDNNSARLFVLDQTSCCINLKYTHTNGVRHIHAIHAKDNNEIIITTGDRLKMLDSWVLQDNKIIFKKRLKRYLTGYTGISNIAGKLYFGTDFSARPNYIETEKGTKYFFPEKAYKKFVMSFHNFEDRYILIFSSDLDEISQQKTLSIFDTKTLCYIYCDTIILPD